MTPEKIKKRVTIETVGAYYGGNLDVRGKGQCLFHEKHAHGDRNPSMFVKDGRVRCWSQVCLGEHAVDVFGLARIMENIDTSSPLGKAMFTIVSAIAELERNIIIERIKGGMATAKARGVRIGRRPTIDEHLTQQILQMNGMGKSIREIAKALYVSKSAVHKTLKLSRAEHLDKSGTEGLEIAV